MAHRFQGPGIQASTTTRRTASPGAAQRGAGGRELVQLLSLAVGVVFVLVGLLGFVPGVTTPLGDLALFGPESEAKLLGIFQVSVLHNVVHLLFGVVGLAAAKAAKSAGAFLVGGGLLYAGVWLYGVLVDKESDLNFLPLNAADDILHLALALGMILLGLVGVALAKRSASA